MRLHELGWETKRCAMEFDDRLLVPVRALRNGPGSIRRLLPSRIVARDTLAKECLLLQ